MIHKAFTVKELGEGSWKQIRSGDGLQNSELGFMLFSKWFSGLGACLGEPPSASLRPISWACRAYSSPCSKTIAGSMASCPGLLWDLLFVSWLRNPSKPQGHEDIYLCFKTLKHRFLKIFSVFTCMFTCMVHLKLIFEWNPWVSPLKCMDIFVNTQVTIHKGLFLDSILFHCSLCLFLCQYTPSWLLEL